MKRIDILAQMMSLRHLIETIERSSQQMTPNSPMRSFNSRMRVEILTELNRLEGLAQDMKEPMYEYKTVAARVIELAIFEDVSDVVPALEKASGKGEQIALEEIMRLERVAAEAVASIVELKKLVTR